MNTRPMIKSPIKKVVESQSKRRVAYRKTVYISGNSLQKKNDSTRCNSKASINTKSSDSSSVVNSINLEPERKSKIPISLIQRNSLIPSK